jgi:cytochrome c peroxidase
MRIAIVSLLLSISPFIQAQVGPLGGVPVPPENQLTPSKIALGKTLFWDEQLSSTGTIACGSCHRSNAGGSDPRSVNAGNQAVNAGTDGIIGNADDVHASPGVPRHGANGHYQWSAAFGLRAQVGARKSPSAINAAYATSLLWDGRAGASFVDPLSGVTLLTTNAALESQALMPLIDDFEMSPLSASIGSVAGRIEQAKPLALAHQVPVALSAWIAQRSYAQLFAEAFGDPSITPAKIAMAIASYERSLISNQAPVDLQQALTPEEQRGQQLFGQLQCAGCHAGALMTDHSFKYIGVRPPEEDLARFAQTNVPADRGAFKVPSLRNVALRAPYMHNGRFQTLSQVVDFYARGGDFDAPNKDPRVRPRNIPPADRQALVAFLSRPITDPRISAEQAPFDRPRLYIESTLQPVVSGFGSPGVQAQVPAPQVIEPALLARTMTMALSQVRANTTGVLVIASADPGVLSTIPTGDVANLTFSTTPLNAVIGYASVRVPVTGAQWRNGSSVFARFYVNDIDAAGGLAISPLIRIPVFGDQTELLMQSGFED